MPELYPACAFPINAIGFTPTCPALNFRSGPWFCVMAKHFLTYICHPPSPFHEPSGSNGQIAL